MSKISLPTNITASYNSLKNALLRAESALEGMVGSENIYQPDDGITAISSSKCSDMFTERRFITGNKFYDGYMAADSMFGRLITLLNKSVEVTVVTGRTAFILNPLNTEYAPLPSTGWFLSKKEDDRIRTYYRSLEIRDTRECVLIHPITYRPVTLKRLTEMCHADIIKRGGVSVENTVERLSLSASEYGLLHPDTPVISINKYYDTDITSSWEVSIEYAGTTYEETTFNLILYIKNGLPKDKYFTLMIEINMLCEVIL